MARLCNRSPVDGWRLSARLLLAAVALSGSVASGQSPTPAPSGAPQTNPGAEDNRLPVPSAAAVVVALNDLKTTFKQEYGKHSAADRHTLATTLLTTAEQPGNEAASEFVLYSESRDLAIAAGDCKTALRAIDDLCRRFLVNGAEIKSKAGAALVQIHLSPSESAELAVFFHAAAADAIALRDYASAQRLAGVEETAAAHSHRDALIAAAQVNSHRAHALLVESERGESALKKLKANPNDPQANLEAGRFFCFVKSDWEHGLPLLAKGSDAELKSLALSDQSHPSDLKSIMYIAEKWWKLSMSRHGDETAFRERAAFWYRQAVPLANGLELVLAQRRIAGAGAGADATVAAPQITILKAEYGREARTISVVKQIQAALDADASMPISVDNRLGGDPAPGAGKHLALAYRMDGKQIEVDLRENAVCFIPPFPDDGIATPGAAWPLKIVKASYGVTGSWIDVTQAVIQCATSPSAEIPAGISLAGKDPAFGMPKHVVIWYEFEGRRCVRIAGDAPTRIRP